MRPQLQVASICLKPSMLVKVTRVSRRAGERKGETVGGCTVFQVILSSESPKYLIKLLKLTEGLRKDISIELYEEFDSMFCIE